MATYTFNVHSPASKKVADAYFEVGKWYYSSLSQIIAEYSCVEKNKGVWIGGGGTVDDGVRMLSINEWRLATEGQIKYAKNCIKNKTT